MRRNMQYSKTGFYQHKYWLTLISLFVIMALAACVPVAPTGSEATGSEGATEEMPTLVIWTSTTFTPDADEVQDNLIRQWGEDNGVEVEINRMSQDVAEARWQTSKESKQFPDCANLRIFDLPQFVLNGDLAETTDVMARLNELEGGFTQGAFVAGRTADGKHWSVPSFSSTEIFYVRQDKLEEKGLDIPETWDEVFEVAKAIHEPGELWGWGMQMGTPSWDSEVAFTSKLWSFGGKTWDEEGKPAIDSPETRQLLDFLKEVWDSGVVPPDGPTWSDGSNNQAYQTEIIGMAFNTGSILRYLQTEDPELMEKTEVTLIPAGPEGRFVSGYFYQWGAFQNSPNADLCLDLLEWLFSPDQLRPYYEAGGGNLLPTYKNMIQDEMWQNPSRKVLAEMIAYTYPQGYPSLTYPWVQDAWDDHTMVRMLNRVLIDDWSNDEAIAEAEEALWKWYNEWHEESGE